MRTAYVAMAMLCIAIPPDSRAQNNIIQGQLSVKPPSDPIEVVLEIKDDGEVVKAVEVQPSRPYRFRADVPAGSASKDVKVFIVVETEEYVPWDMVFEKYACCVLDIKPRIRKREDLYITLRRAASDQLASDRSEARRKLERAAQLAQTIGQKSEIQRILARMDFDDSGCKTFRASECNERKAIESLERLAVLFKETDFMNLGAQRTRAYWQERLDYLLWQINFYGQNNPLTASAGFLAADPLYGRLWSGIVSDFAKSYPDSRLSPGRDETAVGQQLTQIHQMLTPQ